MKTRLSSWELLGYRFVARFIIFQLGDVVERCIFCWKMDVYSTNAVCSTSYGRARVLSTPRYSDVWVVVETRGKIYVVCCEDRGVCLLL